MRTYILDSAGEPLLCDDLTAWARFMAQDAQARRVGGDYVTVQDGTVVFVSTMFLGLDHGFRSPRPVLWETMIFNWERDQYCVRYNSRAAAIEDHAEALGFVLADAMIVDGKPVHTNDKDHETAR